MCKKYWFKGKSVVVAERSFTLFVDLGLQIANFALALTGFDFENDFCITS